MKTGEARESLVSRSLADLAEMSFDAVVAFDSRERITYWNPAAEQLYGWTEQEALGKTSAELFGHAGTPQEQKNQKNRLSNLKPGEIVRSEQEICRKDGSALRVQYAVRAISKGEGKHTGYLAMCHDISAQDALRDSEERYRDLVRHAPAGIYELDPRTMRFIEVNDSMCEILGYTREELLSKIPEELLDEEGRERFKQRMFQTLAGEKVSHQTEYKVKAKDGHEIWGILNITVNYADGKPRSLSVVAHDITERKRAEQALRDNQATLQSFYDSAPFMMGIVEVEGDKSVLISGNRALAEFFAREPQSMTGHRSSEMGTPADVERMWVENYRKSLQQGTPIQFEFEYPQAGCGRWFRSTASFITIGPSGKPRFSFVTEDITERNRTRQQIFESNQRLMALMNSLPVGVTFSDDPTCQHITGNPMALAQFGVDRKDNLSASAPDNSAPGRQVQYFRDGKLITDADLPLQRALAENREIPPMELEVHLPSGQRWWASASGAPVCDQNGSVIGGVAVTQDITARKQAEEALRENERQLQLLNETLEQKVQEKTMEVHRLASDVIQAVQHERYRISHILHDDLQQRIYAIQMQLTLLHDALQSENETARRDVSEIEQQLSEILAVTRHLSIDLSPPILRDEGLSHAIDWLAVQMRQRYGLSIELQADEPFAIQDEALHVLLFNCVRELLFNIVKHAQASRAIVTLKWVETNLLIEVRDHGKGFLVKTLEQPTSREGNGENHVQSGFGLSTIRYQLDLFGGYMEIQSEPGAGTRVVLIVPVAKG